MKIIYPAHRELIDHLKNKSNPIVQVPAEGKRQPVSGLDAHKVAGEILELKMAKVKRK